MTNFLAMALLVVATSSTLAAFGGKTWREGPEPVLERITPRGWVSLLCLALAFVFGIWKETSANSASSAKEAKQIQDNLKSEAQHKTELAAASTETAAAKAREESADAQLEDLNALVESLQDQVAGDKASLREVRNDLLTTKDQLVEQNTGGMITSFANSARKVREAYLYIPFTRFVRLNQSIRGAFLPRFSNQTCSDIVGLNLETPFSERDADVYISPSEIAREHHSQRADLESIAVITPIQDVLSATPDFKDILRFIAQPSQNGEMFFAAFRDPSKRLTAAQFYAAITNKFNPGLAITSDWPTRFRTAGDYEIAKRKYPDILTQPVPNGLIKDWNIAASRAHPMPKSCAAEEENYFRAAFNKATLIVLLDQEQSEVIVLHLTAQKPVFDDNEVFLPFKLDRTPIFTTGSMLEVERVSALVWGQLQQDGKQ